MKRNIVRFVCVLQFVAAIAYAQISVKKSAFTPVETNFYNIEISIARNTRTGESLIAWQKTSGNGRVSEILVKVINAKGKSITAAISIAEGPGLGDVSATYNPISDEYAVVYDNEYSGGLESRWSVFAKLLNLRGRPKGNEVVISSDSISQNMSNLTPEIAFHPKTGGYVVVWLRNIEPFVQQCGVVGTLLDQKLARTAPVKMIRRSKELFKFALPTSIAFLPGGNKLLIAMQQFVEGEGQSAKSDYFLATLDPMLKNIRQSDIARINRDAFPREVHGSVTFTFLPDQSGILFFVDSNKIIRSRNINVQGRLVGQERAAFNSPKDNTPLTNPAVAFSTNAKGTQGVLMGTVYDNGNITWAQLLDSKGNPVGAPVQVDGPSIDEAFRSALLTALPINPVEKLYHFNWYGPSQHFTPSGSLASAGIVELKLTVDVP